MVYTIGQWREGILNDTHACRSGIKVITKEVTVGRTSCHIAHWRCVEKNVPVDVSIDVHV